jgi:hypothetical protein
MPNKKCFTWFSITKTLAFFFLDLTGFEKLLGLFLKNHRLFAAKQKKRIFG